MGNHGRYFEGWRCFLEIHGVFPISLHLFLKKEMQNPNRKPPGHTFWVISLAAFLALSLLHFTLNSPYSSSSYTWWELTSPNLPKGVFPFFSRYFSSCLTTICDTWHLPEKPTALTCKPYSSWHPQSSQKYSRELISNTSFNQCCTIFYKKALFPVRGRTGVATAPSKRQVMQSDILSNWIW